MFKEWLYLYNKLRTSTSNRADCRCPECGSNTIDYQFVGDLEKRIGYLDIWCATCNYGVHMSRVIIPEGESIISFDDPSEVLTARIPNFVQVTPAK